MHQTLSAFVFIALLGSAAGTFAQPIDVTRVEEIDPSMHRDIGTLTAEQWREDVRFLAAQIRADHPNPFRFSSADSFERELAALDAAIPVSSPAEILAGMLRLVALVHDGHTQIPMGFPGLGGEAVDVLGFQRLPVRLYAFEDGLTIIAATPEWRRLLGARIVAIGGRDVATALETVRAHVPADNETAALDRAPTLLQIPEILMATGLSESSTEVKLTVEREGSREDVTIAAVPPPMDWIEARGSTSITPPLWKRNPERNYWSEWLPDGSLYVQYNRVRNQEEESIQAFFDRLFAEAEDRQAERMILDMRFNTGGSTSLNWPIVYGLIRSDTLNRRGRLFVLIGRRTFSAAQNGVNALERHTNAVFVGEPSGETPNLYGDSSGYETPNSKIPFFVSRLFWQNHPRDDRPWTPPEIFAPPTAETYLAGRDPALEAIEGWDPVPFVDRFVERLEDGGFEAASEILRAFRSDPRNRFIEIEEDLNRLGYTLLGDARREDALAVFRLVVEFHPESANAFDSLAEALWSAGDREGAIRQYEHAIELDPDGSVGSHARRMIERVEAGEPAPAP